jgi:acetyl esterase/lipase
MIRIVALGLLICWNSAAFGQTEFPLYNGLIPGSTNAPDEENMVTDARDDVLYYKVSRPTLTAFFPPENSANGTAVIICPGGGYHVLVAGREGTKIAKAFNEAGIAAFVLKYRLPDDKSMTDKSTAPLQDAQQAIRTIRERASEWNIDPNKIGIMGFSAGGHLAATAATHFKNSFIENKKGTSLRPDFMILVYPVISFSDSIGHLGSRDNLLGKSAASEKIRFFSNEFHVTESTPPAFITLAGDDRVVPEANSLSFYNELRKHNVPVAMHIYASGDHGFLKQPSFEEWFGRCLFWIKSNY